MITGCERLAFFFFFYCSYDAALKKSKTIGCLLLSRSRDSGTRIPIASYIGQDLEQERE